MIEDGSIPLRPSHRQERIEYGRNSFTAHSSPPNATSDTAPSSCERHLPLRFVFSGYSLWLELEQREFDDDGRGDLDRAVFDAALRFRLGSAIPSPHVTALYGFGHVEKEGEIVRLFREDVKRVLLEEAVKRRTMTEKSATKDDDTGDCDGENLWPDLKATGMNVDVEFDGVNGGTMVRDCLSPWICVE